MSLYEAWDAAASSPFQPTLGKENQLNVGFLLLLIGENAANADIPQTNHARGYIYRSFRTE